MIVIGAAVSDIVARRNTPEVSRPRTNDQEQQRHEQRQADLPVPLTSRATLKLLPPHVDNLTLPDALAPSPLEMPKITRPEAADEHARGDHDRTSRKHNIYDNNIIVGVVVAILDDTRDNTDDDGHGVINGDLDSIARAEDLLVPHGRANRVDYDSRAKHGCDTVDTE